MSPSREHQRSTNMTDKEILGVIPLAAAPISSTSPGAEQVKNCLSSSTVGEA